MASLTPTHAVVQYIKSNIDAATRFWLYLVAFLSGAVTAAAVAVTAALAPEHAVTVAAVGGALTGLASTVAGGLGAVYVDFPLPDDHPIFTEDDEPDTGGHG